MLSSIHIIKKCLLCVNIEIATMHLCNGERVILPTASTLFENIHHDYQGFVQCEGMHPSFKISTRIAPLCIVDFQSSHWIINYVLHDFVLCEFFKVDFQSSHWIIFTRIAPLWCWFFIASTLCIVRRSHHL